MKDDSDSAGHGGGRDGSDGSGAAGESPAPDARDDGRGVVACVKCGVPGESIDAALAALRCPDCGYEWSA
jgi:hypothetical protein